jgi:hypothetical protein
MGPPPICGMLPPSVHRTIYVLLVYQAVAFLLQLQAIDLVSGPSPAQMNLVFRSFLKVKGTLYFTALGFGVTGPHLALLFSLMLHLC